jgi:hypothetical protein
MSGREGTCRSCNSVRPTQALVQFIHTRGRGYDVADKKKKSADSVDTTGMD